MTIRAPRATSYRRRLLNAELDALALASPGLDIGGGRRTWGRPLPPGWLTVDLKAPATVLADVCALPFRPASFATVKVIEVLEHVEYPRQAVRELRRILRPGGRLILSAPFQEPLHDDPEDYGRYTDLMWRRLLTTAGFSVDRITAQGGYWTHLASVLRFLLLRCPGGSLLLPVLDLLARLDRWAGPDFGAWVGGWFIVAKKDGEMLAAAWCYTHRDE